jgi:hypothetical protein
MLSKGKPMADGQPEDLILQMLRDMRAGIARIDEKIDTKVDTATADLRSEINSLRADVASDLHTTRKEISEQIVGLRRAVIDYHSSVIGHGNIIADLEARLRRVEQSLGLENH